MERHLERGADVVAESGNLADDVDARDNDSWIKLSGRPRGRQPGWPPRPRGDLQPMNDAVGRRVSLQRVQHPVPHMAYLIDAVRDRAHRNLWGPLRWKRRAARRPFPRWTECRREAPAACWPRASPSTSAARRSGVSRCPRVQVVDGRRPGCAGTRPPRPSSRPDHGAPLLGAPDDLMPSLAGRNSSRLPAQLQLQVARSYRAPGVRRRARSGDARAGSSPALGQVRKGNYRPWRPRSQAQGNKRFSPEDFVDAVQLSDMAFIACFRDGTPTALGVTLAHAKVRRRRRRRTRARRRRDGDDTRQRHGC